MRRSPVLPALMLALSLPAPAAAAEKSPLLAGALSAGLPTAAVLAMNTNPYRWNGNVQGTLFVLGMLGLGSGQLYAGDPGRAALVVLGMPVAALATSLIADMVLPPSRIGDYYNSPPDPFVLGLFAGAGLYVVAAGVDAALTAQRANQPGFTPTPFTLPLWTGTLP